ncbi:MAG TPA: hypothetical protein P5555_07225, partial [Candidatus Paceibacterota bacterium]|nr:hypothetical protein [Verrucomicrobiota bacterium]HRZ44967.1 hypothetical protein [Candidatus Paceibacterota bacterium]HRZ94848.1 hypothetical protein [Candidatus Paceibacterota bacterium]
YLHFQTAIFTPCLRRRQHNADLGVGGGYSGFIRVKIEERQAREFEGDWESKDWTRFPARIRAAATALRDTGHFGTFDISHQDGKLRISEA